jgi:hypothetical protein
METTMTTLADGCCSAVTPCSWQRANPSTLCDTCRAASPSVADWLAEQEAAARGRANDCRPDSDKEHWHRAQAAAYEAAHAYAVARPDRAPVTKCVTWGTTIADADLAYLAGLAISSKDATLARIAAALLLAR